MEAIREIYDATIARTIRDWCNSNNFDIGERISEHVVRIKWISAAKLRQEVEVRAQSHMYPAEKPLSTPADAKCAARLRAAESAAESIFRANDPSAIDKSPRTSGEISASLGAIIRDRLAQVFCPICEAQMRANMDQRATHIASDCCAPNRAHYLLLCPDAIIAQCCDGRDNDVKRYAVIHYLDIPPLINNSSGSWSFDFIARISFDLHSREGFIAFRTYTMCNIARIIEKRKVPIMDAPSLAPMVQDDGAKKGSKLSRVFSRIRRKTGQYAAERSSNREAQCASVDHEGTAAAASTVVEITSSIDKEYIVRYIIRNKIGANEIALTLVQSFDEALGTPARPLTFAPEIAREFAHLIDAIFNQEFSRNYFSAQFDPQPICAKSRRTLLDSSETRGVSMGVISPNIFNYWRGWKWPEIIPSDDPPNRAKYGPIVTYIAQVICAADTAFSRHTPADIPSDLAHFLISWFAQIIQHPEERIIKKILVLRGFSSCAVNPIIEFMGSQVIGAQYFANYTSVIAQSSLRPDILFTAYDIKGASSSDIQLTNKFISHILEHKHARAIIIANDARWRPTREQSMIIAPHSMFIDARATDGTPPDMPTLNDDCAHHMFEYLARLSPLALNY